MGAKRKYTVMTGETVVIFHGPGVMYRNGVVTSIEDRLVRIRCGRRTLTFNALTQFRRGGGTQYFRTWTQVTEEDEQRMLIDFLANYHDVVIKNRETWTNRQLRELLTHVRNIRPEQIGEAP